MKALVKLATSNKGKATEFAKMFHEHGLELEIAYLKTIEIQSDSLENIAAYSSLQAFNTLNEPVFVEDAGLFINSLNGFPGPYSSFAYKTIGIDGVLRLVEGHDRTVVFKSVIALYAPDYGVVLFKGECKGRLASFPRGENGFGFDPIFIPDEGDGRTFAEMETDEKNRLSHRGKATRRLIKWLKEKDVALTHSD